MRLVGRSAMFGPGILLALLLGLLLSACGLRGGPEKDTLRMNIGGEPPSLDWDITTDGTSFDVVSNLMVGLTQYTSDEVRALLCPKLGCS